MTFKNNLIKSYEGEAFFFLYTGCIGVRIDANRENNQYTNVGVENNLQN